MAPLVSFDIDGTLAMGDPPGFITMDMVRLVHALGYRIGSASDRSVRDQQRLWAAQGISVDFTVLKHRLADVKTQFLATVYYHIGDTALDAYYATQAGFAFLQADPQTCQPWGPELFRPR